MRSETEIRERLAEAEAAMDRYHGENIGEYASAKQEYQLLTWVLEE